MLTDNKNRPGVWRRAAGALFAMLLFGYTCTAGGCKSPQSDDVPMLAPADGGLVLPSARTYAVQAESIPVGVRFMADGYCVPAADARPEKKRPVKAALLFDITDQEILFTQDCFTKIYPASTTKLLTALTFYRIIEEEGRSLSEQVTIREDNGGITIYGAKLCGFMKGDVVSLEGLLNGLLVYSGNDAAVAIAEYLCGSEADFVKRMNEIAWEIGATHTHFVNPHGLHNSEHYTTAYDMYLIFRECLQQEGFLDIAGKSAAVIDYYGVDGRAKQMELESTNQFLIGKSEVPDGVTVHGGKTGSTTPAGDCLMLFSSCGGREYISAVFGASSRDVLYKQMGELLSLEPSAAD